MHILSRLRNFPYAVLVVFLVWNCAPTPQLDPDYSLHKPKVILVLPPENTTSGTQVEETVYPIVYEKTSNRGYYCLSPELVKGIFVTNKLEDAARINTLPLTKFKEIFGADAVLKIKVLDWSSKYVILSSTVTVKLEMHLIDIQTGKELWSLTNVVSKSPNNSGGGIAGALMAAAMNAAFTAYEPIVDENAKIMLGTLPEGNRGSSQ
jgi:hypothetical protein